MKISIKNTIKVLAVGTALMLMANAASAANSLDRILSAGKITIGVQNDVPPYSQIGGDNNVEGLDIDIAKAIAKDLGVDIELKIITGANRIPTLETNQADLVIATVGINPTRAATVGMSIPYTAFPMVLIASKGQNIKSYADTAGKVIGLTRGTLQDEIVSRSLPAGAEIRRYEDDATTIQALVTGQIDATSFSTTVMKIINEKNPKLNLEAKFPAFFVYAAIISRHEDPRLRDWVNTWIFLNKKSGLLNQIHQKWLQIDLPELPVF
ncbi:MAG: transporter substrate-binding domain-containing protein [Rhizobiales bacterium]|nr:transporter substrate-binding domain-containing protein [Hyphomicrobiales bacterium]